MAEAMVSVRGKAMVSVRGKAMVTHEVYMNNAPATTV